ncbi:DUF2141 domain-containing protein [Bacteroidota bacterium]
MIITILILSLIALFSKKRKKNSIRNLSIFLLFLISLKISAQDNTYNISGELTLTKTQGQVYIYLVDKESFEVPFSGIDTIIYKANSNTINFEFDSVKKGQYSIRAFQDLNNNKKLDKKYFIPFEPWVMSWNGEKTFPPKFENVSFYLNKDMYLLLELKK